MCQKYILFILFYINTGLELFIHFHTAKIRIKSESTKSYSEIRSPCDSPSAGGLPPNLYVSGDAATTWTVTRSSQSIGVVEITVVGIQIVVLGELEQITLGEGGLNPKYHLIARGCMDTNYHLITPSFSCSMENIKFQL